MLDVCCIFHGPRAAVARCARAGAAMGSGLPRSMTCSPAAGGVPRAFRPGHRGMHATLPRAARQPWRRPTRPPPRISVRGWQSLARRLPALLPAKSRATRVPSRSAPPARPGSWRGRRPRSARGPPRGSSISAARARRAAYLGGVGRRPLHRGPHPSESDTQAILSLCVCAGQRGALSSGPAGDSTQTPPQPAALSRIREILAAAIQSATSPEARLCSAGRGP